MSDIAIQVNHLSKRYRLGVINNGTLWKDFQTWAAIKMGREDPHSKIGEDKYSTTDDYYWALRDLNFEIKQGDRVGIIGKNGAGKSTLLKILSRVTAPTEGQIKIKGKVSSLLEVGTGFHGELTGRENIYLNGAILGMKKRQIDRKLDEIIAFSEIEHHIDTPVKRYSSGMYVRLAFAVAAHLDSDILIADEVLAVGDAAFQKKALGKMNDLSTEQGKTVLFVSHNMGAVTALCNYGMILKNGVLLKKDYIESCISEYLYSSMNSLNPAAWEGSIGDDHLKIYAVSIKSINNEYRTSFLKGEKIILLINFEILLPRFDYVFCVEICNNLGTILIENSATEFFENNLETLYTVGKKSIEVEIDTSIFADGDYIIKFDFSIRNLKRVISDEPSLSFSIEANQEKKDNYVPKRNNIISPLWNWKLRY